MLQKSPASQEGFLHIFILLGILALVVGSYVLVIPKLKDNGILKKPESLVAAQSKDPDNDLSLFKSEQYGFEFKYRNQEVTVKNDSEEDYSKRGQGDFRKNFTNYIGYEPPKLVKAVAALAKDNSFDLAPFVVWVFENPNKLDGSGWYDNYWYYPFMWGVFAWNHKYMPQTLHQATISGQTVEYRLLSYQNGAPKYFYFPHKGKMVLIRVLTEKNNGEKILETFRLID